jgi:hypothetical protein
MNKSGRTWRAGKPLLLSKRCAGSGASGLAGAYTTCGTTRACPLKAKWWSGKEKEWRSIPYKKKNTADMKRIFTPEKLEKLKQEFPHRKTADIAADMDFHYYTVSNKAHALGLKKTAEFMREHGNRLQGERGKATRFKKGHVPANKGKKMPDELKERIKHTFFQPGHVPATTKHFGKPYLYERVKKNGKIEKLWWIQESTNKRSAYLAYLCRKHGIDLTGKKPRLKPGFDHSRPPTIDDIVIISNQRNMELNSFHNNYPEQVRKLIQIKGALTRQINKLKEDEQE